jgi:AcrR family transcriptional regulator
MAVVVRVRAVASEARRRDILGAALESFSRVGFAAATMEDIRRGARASTGSIYHHFASKEQLAAALYVEGLRDYQRGFVRVLARHRAAQAGVRAMVDYHLRWVARHPDWARFLLDMGRAEFVVATQGTIQEVNRAFLSEVEAWLAPHVERGEIVALPIELYAPIVIGPSQQLARAWLTGGAPADMARVRRELANAAWRSLAGPAQTTTTRRRTKHGAKLVRRPST